MELFVMSYNAISYAVCYLNYVFDHSPLRNDEMFCVHLGPLLCHPSTAFPKHLHIIRGIQIALLLFQGLCLFAREHMRIKGLKIRVFSSV